MTAARQVKNLTWYCQGHTFTTDIIVLDLLPYDVILGYGWLKQYSPMHCDWVAKTISFPHKGKHITLQGLHPPPMQLSSISAKQVYKSTQGNDIWAYVILDITQPNQGTRQAEQNSPSEDIQLLLHQYVDVFSDPQQLPPSRSYDHAIPLLPDQYQSTQGHITTHHKHKTEIEIQVK